MEQILQVDDAACIGCGECAADCPATIIEMRKDRPLIGPDQAERCVQCQHCLAVCPKGALSIHGYRPGDSERLPGSQPSADQMAMLIKSRRTTRRFQAEPLDREKIDFMMQTLAYAPTAVNNRQLLFTFIDDPVVMEDFRNATYQALQMRMDTGGLPAGFEYLERALIAARESGQDILFRGAPHFLIVSSPMEGYAAVDSHIALSYFELLAATMGVGTVWSGLAYRALTRLAPDLLGKLGIPQAHTLGYMMAFGRPAVRYHRTVQRQNRAVNRVSALR